MNLFDIGKVKETTEIALFHPVTGEALRNGDGTDMTITVYGPYSKHYKALMHEQQNRRLAKAQRSGGKLTLSAEELEASAFETLLKCITGWNVTLENDGKKSKFTEDAARKVLTELPWVREQIEAVFTDTRAFLA